MKNHPNHSYCQSSVSVHVIKFFNEVVSHRPIRAFTSVGVSVRIGRSKTTLSFSVMLLTVIGKHYFAALVAVNS